MCNISFLNVGGRKILYCEEDEGVEGCAIYVDYTDT